MKLSSRIQNRTGTYVVVVDPRTLGKTTRSVIYSKYNRNLTQGSADHGEGNHQYNQSG